MDLFGADGGDAFSTESDEGDLCASEVTPSSVTPTPRCTADAAASDGDNDDDDDDDDDGRSHLPRHTVVEGESESAEWAAFRARYLRERPDFGAADASPPLPSSSSLCIDGDADELFAVALRERYPLSAEQIEAFRARRFVRLSNAVPTAAVALARERLIKLASRACGGRNPSVPAPGSLQLPASASSEARWECLAENLNPAVRSWHLQMMWAVEPVVRALVLSPRIGGIVAELLGCEDAGVRLYHDNCLSRAPGCKRTRWHCDDGPNGYMAMATGDVVTVWIPLQRTTPAMGSLAFASDPVAESDPAVAAVTVGAALRVLPRGSSPSRGPSSRCDSWSVAARPGCPPNEQSDEYDAFAANALRDRGLLPDEATYALGDISVHRSDCFHTAGPNLTEGVRMIIGTTYFADGATMRDDIDLSTAPKGIANDWGKFCPDVSAGEPIATRRNPKLEAPFRR